MKKIALLILVIILCCCFIGLFLEGYFLPYKPCRPIIYPDGRKTTKNLAISIDDPLNEILSFYDARLRAKAISEINIGEWGKELIQEDVYLYQCYSADINLLTTESGCIYISHDGIQSSIKIEFYRSEGGYTPCPR